MLTSAFGASIAHSMATAYGWAGTSSGRMRTGFWQLRTKSRVTVKTKSGLVSNIFLTNLSVVSCVISGRLAISVLSSYRLAAQELGYRLDLGTSSDIPAE